MKKILIVALFILFIGNTLVFAENISTGVNAEIKIEYFRFLDDRFKNPPMETWMFIGIGVYKELFIRNLYFGVETGWAGTSGIIDACGVSESSGINYVPVEFNAKYKIKLSPRLNLNLGTGLSYNYFHVDINENTELGPLAAKSNTWVFGGQVFGELNYKLGNWFLGISGKYQVTEDARVTCAGPNATVKELFPGGKIVSGGIPGGTTRKSATISTSNLRLGIQIGYAF